MLCRETNWWKHLIICYSWFSAKKIEKYSWFTFLSPFHWTIWLSILALYAGATVALWVFHRYPKGQEKLNILGAFVISFSSIFGISIRQKYSRLRYLLRKFSSLHKAVYSVLAFYLCNGLINFTVHTFPSKILMPFTGPKNFCASPKIYLHIVAVTNILCQTKRWFAFSKIGFCAGKRVFEEALNAVKF